MDFVLFYINVLLQIPYTVELYVHTEVGGCEWTISTRAICIGTASFAAKNIAPSSASASDATITSKILQSVWISPFNLIGLFLV